MLRPDGTPDPSFSKDGIAASPVAACALAVQPDGKVVVAGSIGRGNPGRDVALVRFLANGRIDRGFGRRGLVRLAPQIRR
jgi:hypothetical protein